MDRTVDPDDEDALCVECGHLNMEHNDVDGCVRFVMVAEVLALCPCRGYSR